MKITRLAATGIHGHITVDVEFLPDLTFLTGLNGSGKTTVLRLLMAALTPHIEEFAHITFATLAVTIADSGKDITISAFRTTDSLELRLDSFAESLVLTSAELQLLVETRRREELRSPLQEKVVQHPVFRAIAAMSTPIFLGLDRKQYSAPLSPEEQSILRHRELVVRRQLMEDGAMRDLAAAGLADAGLLVTSTMQEIRALQESLDERLRNQILTGAFKYKPRADVTMGELPSRAEIQKYRGRQEHIEAAARRLRLPVPEVNEALTDFFSRMNAVVDALEADVKRPQGKKRSKKFLTSVDFLEWIINKPQVDRIFEHMSLLDQYGQDRLALHEPINRFLRLVNGFLLQTGKEVQVTDSGALRIDRVTGTEHIRVSTTGLSSGERQILVILAHLSLSKSLSSSGVFIVDEPELSLHISWQERFVAAVREANPSVQLIMATHSPAIILDLDDHCRTLSVSGDK